MFRLARLLTTLLAFTLFAANSASAITASLVEKPASGLFGALQQRVGIDALASAGRIDEKLSLLYDFASDFPVAARGLDHVVLGKSIGLEARAASIGGRHLMGSADWQRAVMEAIANPGTKISVDVAGLEGAGSVSSRVLAAIQRGASGRGSPLDWELAQLRQSGRLSTVDFFEDANAIANPFR